MEGVPQPYILVDRDAIMLSLVNSYGVSSGKQVEFLPRALHGLRSLTQHGYGVLVLCYEGCAGSDALRPHQLRQIEHRFRLEIALAGGKIERLYCCAHKTERACHSHRPALGLALRALGDFGLNASHTHIVTPSEEHLDAALSAGCPGVLLRREAFLRSETSLVGSAVVASDLLEAAEWVVSLAGTQVPRLLEGREPVLPSFPRMA